MIYFMEFLGVTGMNSFGSLNSLWITFILAISFGCKNIKQRNLPTELSGWDQQYYDATQLNSYGNCKVATLTEIFSDDYFPVMVCYSDLQQSDTSAAIAAYVNPKDGWFAVLYRADQLRDVILDETAEWLEMRFDKGEINKKFWLSDNGWDWGFIENKLEYFDNFLNSLASANRLAVRTNTHGSIDEDTRYDLIMLNGTQAAINDFRSRIQGLRGAMEAMDNPHRDRRDSEMQRITSQFIYLK